MSNRLARYLAKKCTHSKKIAALYLEKTDLLVVAILAVLKAGMAWLPLPMDAPPARIEQILRSCEVEWILTLGSKSNNAISSVPCIRLDEVVENPELHSYSDSNLGEIGQNADDLCQILFTSGSTGVPKGVMIEHRAVTHNVMALVRRFNLSKETRTLQFAAPTFDVFNLDLFMTFACGGCVVMAAPSAIMEDITNFIHKAGITYTQMTPTVIRFIDPANVPTLAMLVSSGESLPASLANKWRDRVRLFNAYGPTETIVCTVQELSGNDVDSACIGEALNGLEVCILADGSLEMVPDGEIGEICVAGPQLFKGYRSIESALESRECIRQGLRYYRTGDFGQVENHSKGIRTIRYLGRRDAQIKVHGIRIDLGDIEESILSCRMVQHCAVVLPRHGSSAGRLSCIVVPWPSSQRLDPSRYQPQETGTASTAEPTHILSSSPNILEFLRNVKDTASKKLPAHAIPASWWPVNNLPLTSSGKVDRMKLRTWLEHANTKPDVSHSELAVGESNQATNVSDGDDVKLLQSLWAEVLDRPASSILAAMSFVDLGADSLDVIKLVSKARKAGLDVNFSQVYAAKNIQQLIQNRQIPQSDRNPHDSSYIPFSLLPRIRPLAPILDDVATACGIRVADIEDVYPCTPYQVGLMVLDLRYPTSYVCVFSWTLPWDMDIDRFRCAWEMLMASEPVLRNRLTWDAAVQEFWQVTIRHKGVQDLSIENFERQMALGDDLCRGCIQWSDETQRWTFQLKIHHSIIDGWSLRLMLTKLKCLYSSEDPDPSPRVPFVHFIRYRLEQEGHQNLGSERFWRQYLQNFSQQPFHTPSAESDREIHATEHLSLSVSVDLRGMASEHGVTPATILYGAAALVLATHSDSEDVVFGLILAGRDAPFEGISNMVGPAFATFPYRIQVDGQSTVNSYLKAIEGQILNIIPHQHYGLQRIKQCGPGAATACDFGCLVVVQPEDEMLAGEGLWEKAHGQTSGLADSIPLSFELILAQGQVLIKCNYDPALLSHESLSLILGHFKCVLQSLPSVRSHEPISLVKYTDEDEHSEMLSWVQGYGAPVECCLQNLLLDAVRTHSWSIAIDDQGRFNSIFHLLIPMV